MSEEPQAQSLEDLRHNQESHAPQLFRDAVDTFIDLYKIIIALAIGNCFRSLAQRQIQFKLDSPGGYAVKLENVGWYDSLLFLVVLIFIARFFFGDMAYWKAYRHRKRGRIAISDALILLVNAFALTYMSFFIGYNTIVGIIILAVLAADVCWAVVGIRFGASKATENARSAVRLGVANSFLTLVVVGFLTILGVFPHHWQELQHLSKNANLALLLVLAGNTALDLAINGGRYLGRTDSHLVLKLKDLLQRELPESYEDQ